jgi:hypothetical protein
VNSPRISQVRACAGGVDAAVAHLGISDEKPTPSDRFLLVKVRGSGFADDEAGTWPNDEIWRPTQGACPPLSPRSRLSAVGCRPSVGRDGCEAGQGDDVGRGMALDLCRHAPPWILGAHPPGHDVGRSRHAPSLHATGVVPSENRKQFNGTSSWQSRRPPWGFLPLGWS